ncbi:MAG TPA: type II secretion system protein GspL [Gallionella sp.]|nr:type II secretion system protein GspL [Gallionella sp.]
MSTLYIRLPSKAAAGGAPNWRVLACPFALVSNANLPQGNAIEHQGMASLSDLSDTIAKSQRVVLLLAASDVTIFRLPVPPLSASKLKAALPNLVEERLIADPSECVVVAGGLSRIAGESGELRTIAVVQRAWVDLLARTLFGFGARHIAALPAQLCLPYQSGKPGSVTAAIDHRDAAGHNSEIDLTLRLTENDGIGLALAHEMDEPAAKVAIRTLCDLAPEAPIMLYVPQALVRCYQEAVNESVALSKLINVTADNWSRWIAGARSTTLDLMAGSGIEAVAKFDWRTWRWPLALATLVLFINAAGLNIDWWRLSKEADSLRAAMTQIYKSAYPKESVIIDPLAQMRQKIAIAKHNSGKAAPDDFIALTEALGEAWSNTVTASGRNTAIDSFDYHDRSLYVRLKAGGEAPTEQLRSMLSKYELALELAPGPSGSVVWVIKSAK